MPSILPINLLDDWLVIPSAIGSVVTATLLCWITNYGFTKFYWIIVKWFLTTGLIIFGTFGCFLGVILLRKYQVRKGCKPLAIQYTSLMQKVVLLGTIVQAFFLFIIIGISVLKPWGRRLSTVKKQINTNG
jgi:hypothetical protein